MSIGEYVDGDDGHWGSRNPLLWHFAQQGQQGNYDAHYKSNSVSTFELKTNSY